MRITSIAAAACAAALLVSGCGGDASDDEPTTAGDSSAAAEESESPAAEESEVSAPSFDEADAEAVIQDYFAAQRAGDAAAICALEEEVYQGFKYGYDQTGEACLDNLANNTPQTVWADPIVIVSLDVSEFGVDGVIQPNVSTPDQASITLMPDDEGNLLVTGLQ